MALALQLLSRDPKLQTCLVSDPAHIVEGAAGKRGPKTGGSAMNAVKMAVCLLLPVLAMAPADVCAQSDAPGTQLRGVVPRDAETMVASAAQWRTHEGEAQKQCITNSVPALELVTPPQHGTVRFVYADLGIPKGSGCINPVYGQAVMYRPAPGFVGKDRFTYHVPSDPTAFEHFGRPVGQWTVSVTVR